MASAETTNDESEVREKLRAEWLDCLTALVDSVEGWAREQGWSTRRIEKKMKDSEIGTYQAPALLLQEEFTRGLLEPIGRTTFSAEGVVDLYLMPAYDDIARLVYRHRQWWWHDAPGQTTIASETEGVEPLTLSKESLQAVFEIMKRNVQ